MRKVFFASIIFFFAAGAPAQRVYEWAQDGEVYIKFTAGAMKKSLRNGNGIVRPADLPALETIGSKYGFLKMSRSFWQADDDPFLRNTVRISFSEVDKVDELLKELGQLDIVEFASPVSYNRTSATPNDFALSTASMHLTQINAQNAWNIFNGNSNITVAVVDNSFMWTHADLIGNTYVNPGEISGNSIDDDGNGYVDDVNGYDVADGDNDPSPPSGGFSTWIHGTHCAGVVGASTDNGTGISAIGWNVKVIPVKATATAAGPGGVTHGYEGIIYAAKSKARVISCSWGSAGSANIFEQVVINYAWNRGCIVITAAGNNGNNSPVFPAAYNNVYAVAAVDFSDNKWSGSSFGSYVDICAPGVNIMSTVPYTGSPAYQPLTGTSFAAPMVAGLAALMLSKSPHMTPNDVLNCISNSATNIYTLAANTTYTNQLGAGRIDAYQAMLCAETFSAMPPVANFYAFPLNTCPNTPVAFTDSSYYAPTAWSWTFQGGSPATSTLQYPVVQWPAPGTYSVSLQVSNANGSHAKTKTSYVVVAGPIALPLQEGFENPQFLPPGWTPKNINSDAVYWQRITGVGGFGTSTACAIFDNYNYFAGGDLDEMRTPKYDFGKVATARIRFDVAYARYDQSLTDTLEVRLSTDCGISWTPVYVKGGTQLATAPDTWNQFLPNASQWRRDSVDISALTAGQGNVMFSFVNRGHFGQPIYLDNINLFFPTPILGIPALSPVCAGQQLTVNGTYSHTATFDWTMTGGSPATSTVMSPVVSYVNSGTYSVSLLATNGTASASITRTVAVIDYPVLAATDATVCAGQPATLTVSGAQSYSWNAVGSGSSVVVSPAATTIYTVTGTNGNLCSISRTVVVTVEASPVLSVANVSVCTGSAATLNVSGASTYSWHGLGSGSTTVVSPAATTIYTVTGSNANLCAATRTLSVYVGSSFIIATTFTPPSCGSCSDGTIQPNPTGGTPPFSYNVTSASGNVPSLSGLSQGCYSIAVTDGAGYQDTTIVCLTVIDGLMELDRQPKIYPNPVRDLLTIELTEPCRYRIVNQLGQIVLSGEAKSGVDPIDVSGLSKGVYYLQFSASRESGVTRFVKE